MSYKREQPFKHLVANEVDLWTGGTCQQFSHMAVAATHDATLTR